MTMNVVTNSPYNFYISLIKLAGERYYILEALISVLCTIYGEIIICFTKITAS